MNESTFVFCQKAGYVVLAVFIAAAVIIFMAIWMRAYWAEREAQSAERELMDKRARQHEHAVKAWAALADDRAADIAELLDEVNRLSGEVETLKKLLSESERLRGAEK